MNACCAQIFFWFMRKADHFHALSRELFQIRPHLRVDRSDEPEFRVFQIEAMPGLE